MMHALINQLVEALMDRRIDAHVARTQLGQIMDLAVKNNERFVVDRRGEPAVVIMSVQDFIRTVAPPPDWLQKAWTGAKRRGLDSLTLDEINSEIDATRRDKGLAARGEAR
jgi:prevent-host-death family protein